MQPIHNQHKAILTIAVVVLTVVTITILFKSSSILKEIYAKKEDSTEVIILTSDVITDQSWGSLAYKGKLLIEEQYPVDVTLFSDLSPVSLMVDKVNEIILKDPDIIIGHGREFSNIFAKVAPYHPEIQFVTIHGNAILPNQSVYTFDQQRIEYVSGIIAGMKTKTNKVGIIDAYEAWEESVGFETGLTTYNPNSTFYYSVVNSRDDGREAVRLVDQMIKSGVDVIFSKGNAYNRSVINYAKDKGIYVIGYLEDQSYMGKDTVLTSVLNDVSQIYVAIMRDFFSENGIPAGKTVLDESDGVYRLAPLGPMFNKAERKEIMKAKVKLQNQYLEL